MAGPLLDELYNEALEISEEALSDKDGLITLGIDGHKDGKSRTLETITKAKLGVSSFDGCEYMKTTRATGFKLASIVKGRLRPSKDFIAVVADNTGSNLSMFEELRKVASFQSFFFLGCFVHVLDLLMEDVAKLAPFVEISEKAHTVISFIKSHSIIFEEFLSIKQGIGIRKELHLFPTTRFAYLHLMLESLEKTLAAAMVLVNSAVYLLSKNEVRRRGGEEGRKAYEKFISFERIIREPLLRDDLGHASKILQPISIALHYLEGDSVPLSHVYPVYQGIYDYAQSLQDEMSILNFLGEENCASIVELVKERWFGGSRKVGLKDNVHLLAFVLDPYAQAATSAPSSPMGDLFNHGVLDSARNALRHHIRESEERAALTQQLQMWLAARPDLPTERSGASSSPQPVSQGNNPFSSLYLASMQARHCSRVCIAFSHCTACSV